MSIEFEGKSIPTDDEGYLLNVADWTPQLRDFMANQMGLTLTDAHLLVLDIVREYYQKYDTTPPMRGLIKLLKTAGHTDLASSVALARLFPEGAAKCAAKLAGLPKPVKCI